MKIKAIRPVMVIVLLLLMVSPVASQAPDDKLITPGVGIGRWKLQMMLAELVQMNGPASSNRGGGLDSNRTEYWTHSWERLGVVATATGGRDAQTVDVLIAFTQDHKTAQGVSVSTQRDVVEAAYGKPTAVTRATNSDTRLIYDEIGLWVRILDGTGAAIFIGVFRPGAAKQLWKF
jgi:hypothetical protein